MYPWPDPDGTPLYYPVDLPATVTFDGDTLSHDSGLYQLTGTTYYIVAGTTQWEVRLVSDDSLVQAQDCLISGGVEDEFSECYLLEIDPVFGGETATVQRVSLCRWEGTSDGDSPAFLEYVPPIMAGDPVDGTVTWTGGTDTGGTYNHLPGDSPEGDYEASMTVTAVACP